MNVQVLITESGRSSVISVSQSAATPALQPFIVEAAYQVLPGKYSSAKA